MRVLAAAALAASAAAQCGVTQMYLNYFTPQEMMVSWATTCKSSTTAAWGLSPSKLTHASTGNSSTYTWPGGYTSPFLHNALLSGLPAGTTIYYTAGGDASGNAPVRSFLSQPAPGLAASGSTVFAVIGDLGQTSNSNDTVSHILASPRTLTAVVHVGDLSYADSDEPRWDSYRELVEPLASTIPINTLAGNHEIEQNGGSSFQAYLARFHMPLAASARELHYSFRAGGVHWLMLSSYSDFTPGSAQATWLTAELASVDRSVTPWLVAGLHAPWMNSNTAHHGEGEPMRLALEAQLHAAGVDLILAGHVHAYERSHRVFNNAVDPTGPYFVTIGDGGNREGLAANWYSPQPSWSAFRQASYGHGELEVINATAMHWSWHQNPDLEPTVADDFFIVKGESTSVGDSVTAHPRFASRRA